tara:strand:- start:25862 stop:26086 length:225 start_codon:yes stop_codon:yes gene_type:complete
MDWSPSLAIEILNVIGSHEDCHASSSGAFVALMERSPGSDAAALGSVKSPVKEATRRRKTSEILSHFRLESRGA